MKLTSIVGTGTGKLGGSVFSVRNGAQVVRTYQPVVANPQSEQQIAQRAKLKLASQLSAALANEVAPFGRDGMRSPRNLFVKDLFARDAVTYADDTAEIALANVRLTPSRIDMLALGSVTHADTRFTLSGYVLPEYVGQVISVRVVVVGRDAVTNEPVIRNTGNATIGADNTFTFTGDLAPALSAVVYYYAIVPSSDVMIARYGGITMDDDTAVLLMTSVNDNPSGFRYSISYVGTIEPAQ